MIKYTINGTSLSHWGVLVSKTKGLHDLPKMKQPLTVNWPDRHGEQVDLTAPRYEAREITLECVILAEGRDEFLETLNTFITEALLGPGLKQLVVEYETTMPLVYLVYFAAGIDINRQTSWDAARMAGTFTMKLREPEPFKKVYKFVAVGETMQCNISFTSPGQVTVYWGDGAMSETNTGTPSLQHEYDTEGVFYVAVYGVVEEITNISTNATLVWNLQ